MKFRPNLFLVYPTYIYKMLPTTFSVFFAILCWGIPVCHGESTNKKLVILAGPHETSAENMRRWFDQYATDYDDTVTSSKLGGGWKWPMLKDDGVALVEDNDINRRSIFKMLFDDETESDAPEILRKTIRESWEIAESGIILGHERFDKVGDTPYTQLDALEVTHRIVEDLGIAREDVIVVLLYRTPRLQQWLRIWDVQSHHDEYEDFACDDDEADKRREYMATAMNIGLLSKDFLQNGFNVVVVDEEGTKKSNLDLSHTLACNILKGVECTRDGWVAHLKDELTQVDHQDDSLYQEWTELTLQQLHDLESIFLQRDCAYVSELESSKRFRILNQDTLFAKCAVDKNVDAQEKIKDTGFMVNFVQMQKGCQSGSLDPSSDLLNTSNMTREQNPAAAEDHLLVVLLLILLLTAALLAYVLYQKHGKKHSQVELDGLFSKPGLRNCFFQKRRDSEGSTDGSSDEESTSVSPSKGMSDISLQDETPSLHRFDLCKACSLVRIDPKCRFCFGGQQQSSPDSSPIKIGTNTPYTDAPPDDGNGLIESRNETGSTMARHDTGNEDVRVEDFKFGSKHAELSPRKTKIGSRSRAFRKLKELAKLKGTKSEDGEEMLNPDNLQMDRDDESVSFV
jgi:hypothetical protein